MVLIGQLASIYVLMKDFLFATFFCTLFLTLPYALGLPLIEPTEERGVLLAGFSDPASAPPYEETNRLPRYQQEEQSTCGDNVEGFWDALRIILCISSRCS